MRCSSSNAEGESRHKRKKKYHRHTKEIQVVLQIVEHIAEGKVEGNQGQSQDLGPEIFSLAHILTIEGAFHNFYLYSNEMTFSN